MKKKTWVFIILLGFFTIYTAYGLFKPLPQGLSYEGNIHHISDVSFLYDLTYKKNGEMVKDQQIFEHVLHMINEAEQFILFDMFLFNDKYDDDKDYPEIVSSITEALINKKKKEPAISITFITDEINTTYKSHQSEHLQALRNNNIDVILTNLTPIREANPIYSGFWRMFFKAFGKKGEGWLPNPFSEDAPEVTLRSYLKMLNLKGNHRKVITTEKEAMITSANAHDASGFHSNIAFTVKGAIINDILQSEQAVVNFSSDKILPITQRTSEGTGLNKVQILTEGKTKKHLLKEIKNTEAGDEIYIGMFYLSDNDVVKELILAAELGVSIKLILDPNKTVFGHENIGIPNRPVAADMLEFGSNNIALRWYNTHDEQYHSKLILIKRQDESTIIGGSANFTRRNLDDFNLDTCLKISAPTNSPIIMDVNNYFERIWYNKDGNFTVLAEKYLEFPNYKRYLFRLQKHLRLTTF